MPRRNADRENWILFTLYSYRVDGALRAVSVDEIWKLLATETSAFISYSQYFDTITALRHAGAIILSYPGRQIKISLSHEGLIQAGEIYNERKRGMMY